MSIGCGKIHSIALDVCIFIAALMTVIWWQPQAFAIMSVSIFARCIGGMVANNVLTTDVTTGEPKLKPGEGGAFITILVMKVFVFPPLIIWAVWLVREG